MTPNHTVRQLARDGIALAQRPLAVAAYATGLVKGTVEGAAHATGTLVDALLHQQRGPDASEVIPKPEPMPGPMPTPVPEPEPTPQPEPTGERTLYGGLNRTPAPPMTPGGGGEPFEHEPTAESRDVAHGDAAAQPREVDSWIDEVDEDELADELKKPEPPPDPSAAG